MQNNNIIGYKKARNNILVTLQIPYDAKHNIDRKNISDKQYAKYRCSHAKVIDIIDLDNNTSIDKANSLHDSKFSYTLGQDVICDTFDTNLENVCSEGIHFFLDKDRATFHGINLDYFQGEYKEWYDNGQLKIHTTYKDGNIDGEYKLWFQNGQLYVHTTYQNGKIYGEYKKWFQNGQLSIQTTYKNYIRNGKYLEWNKNGMIMDN